MARPRKQKAPEGGAPEWMTTYGDLVTLLLTFFILLFSMAVIDKQKFEIVASSLRSTFMHNSNGELFEKTKGDAIISLIEQNKNKDRLNEQAEQNPSDEPIDSEQKELEDELIKRANEIKAKNLEYIKGQIEDSIAELNLGEYIKVIEEKSLLILRIDSIILFDSGSADIKQGGTDILKRLGTMLKKLDNDIIIQGHTDNIPINSFLYPSNWELSTRRATNVVVFLIDQSELDPTKLTATGNAEFKPIKPNDSEENRQKNRRIDIVIEK